MTPAVTFETAVDFSVWFPTRSTQLFVVNNCLSDFFSSPLLVTIHLLSIPVLCTPNNYSIHIFHYLLKYWFLILLADPRTLRRRPADGRGGWTIFEFLPKILKFSSFTDTSLYHIILIKGSKNQIRWKSINIGNNNKKSSKIAFIFGQLFLSHVFRIFDIV